MDNHLRETLIQELICQYQATSAMTDVIIVFHNQSESLQKCLTQLSTNTKNYRLHLWDNASSIKCLKIALEAKPTTLIRKADNYGFLHPNNVLVKAGVAPYVILLNSDAYVNPGWKEALVGWLESHPKCGSVGFLGGKLNKDGIGGGAIKGNCEYIHGWCVAIRRSMIEEIGLFDERYDFCHCEDSDLGLRIESSGYENYALHLELAEHAGATTIRSLEDTTRLVKSFRDNHTKFVQKWSAVWPDRFNVRT